MLSTTQQDQIRKIWQEILGLSEVDADRTFIDCGGTSLLANQMVSRLSKELGLSVPVIRVFEYPTLRLLTQFLVEGKVSAPIASDKKKSHSKKKIKPRTSVSSESKTSSQHDIAIVGMACRFPGAKNIDEFWQNLIQGKESIRMLSPEELSPEVPEELKKDPRYVPACGMIEQPYAMDAAFFDINPMEAKLIDPQQRVLLETAWEALEHAGHDPKDQTLVTGVFAGIEDNSYYKAEIMPFPEAEKRAGRFSVMTGNEKDFVAMRIAHKLDLRGPAISVNTACSTSLVAVIMACKSLRLGECDMALAGGASVHFPTPEGYYFQEGGVFSSDGHCRPFDQDAEGTIFTDGSGIVVLKRLEDAVRDHNTIYAVIKGGAINSDGGDKVSFSAPSIGGQSSCIRAALQDASVDPSTIQYVEAHGTATPVGDPIEVEALRQAFGTNLDKKQFCGLGSVKSNIGHTTAAAGVAGLIKTALALKNEVIPQTLHYKRPNPGLDLENSPFYITSQKIDWPKNAKNPRRAGLSSFGIGGTNSHVIIEEAPATGGTTEKTPQLSRPFEILPVSAKTVGSRDELLKQLTTLKTNARDTAYTLQKGRSRFKNRGALVRATGILNEDLAIASSQKTLENQRMVFMFPGQGSQYIEMGKSLYEHFPEFRTTFQNCCEILSREMDLDFKKFIFDSSNKETLENTRYTQPALFAIEVSLGKMLIDWGIEPEMMIGHSVGEFAAAYLSGVFSLEEGLKLISARGRLMASLPRGKMLSARAPHEAVLTAAGEAVDIASINSPVHCVLAGENEKIDAIQARLVAAGIPCKPLHTSHAFHSQMMSPIVEPFLEITRQVKFQLPRYRMISTVTGQPMLDSDITDPMYWANHLRATVKFSPALLKSIEEGGNIFLEIGPRATLSSLATQHFTKIASAQNAVAISTLSDKSDAAGELGALGSALAKLWTAGMELPWDQIWGTEGDLIPLVGYPFERKEFRFSDGRQAQRAVTSSASTAKTVPVQAAIAPPTMQAAQGPSTEELLASQVATLMSEYSGLSVDQISATFIECGFDSLVLMQIGVELGKRYGFSVSLRDLMEKYNTLKLLTQHILSTASPEKLPKPVIAAAPVQQPLVATAPASAQQAVQSAMIPGVLPMMTQSLAPMPADMAQLIRQQLSQMKEIMELQIRYIDQVSLAGGTPAVRQAAPTSPAKKLIRAKHANPPEAGAFRAKTSEGQDAWYKFNSNQQKYELLKH